MAAQADPPVPEDLLPEVRAALEKLEGSLRELEGALEPDTLPWSGPGEQA